jgi:hypothetical protein
MTYKNNALQYLALGTLILMGACTKDSREGMMEESGKPKIAIVNIASPNRPTATTAASGQQGYLMYMDGNLLYNAALITNKTTGYFLAEPGQRSFRVDTTEIGPNVNFPQAPVNTTQMNAEAGKYYTIFYTGKIQSPEVVVTTDDLSRPPSGKARVRVLNLSPDVPSVDIAGRLTTSTSPSTVLFGNLTYKTVNAFQDFNPGFYRMELRAAGTTTVLGSFTQDNQIVPLFIPNGSVRSDFSMNFEAGKVYTLVVRGYRDPSIGTLGQIGHPLSVGALINVYW